MAEPPAGGGMNQRGYVYLVSLWVAMMLAIAGASLLLRSMSESGLSERSHSQAEALHLAEAGVDQAARNLRLPPPSDPNDPSYATNPNIATATTQGSLPTGRFTINVP